MKDWPTKSEMNVMKMLQDKPAGLYGLQVVADSGGAISRGSVYVLLGRLTLKGFVSMTKPKQEPDYPGMPRPIYKLTAEGAHVLRTAEEVGLTLVGATA